MDSKNRMLPYHTRIYLKSLPARKNERMLREEARTILDEIVKLAIDGQNEFIYMMSTEDSNHGRLLTQLIRKHLIDCNVVYFAKRSHENKIANQGLRIYWG